MRQYMEMNIQELLRTYVDIEQEGYMQQEVNYEWDTMFKEEDRYSQ